MESIVRDNSHVTGGAVIVSNSTTVPNPRPICPIKPLSEFLFHFKKICSGLNAYSWMPTDALLISEEVIWINSALHCHHPIKVALEILGHDREIDGLNEQLEEDAKALEHIQLQILQERSRRSEVKRENTMLQNQVSMLMNILQ
ncbi:hypothetical protein Sjap_017437 [Stephania japonica]|uniref:Uncharacterized protein n=1 Tax=Stephania japonica TaxID=461633 RepID=A0AAP0I664_9MAGN